MKSNFRKKVFAAAGATSLFFGPGRKEFDPSKPMPSYETYLMESAKETLTQVKNPTFDEGIIGSFMAAKFLNQANLPAFLPMLVPSLVGKPCTGVEGACGTGGRAIAMAVRSVLSDLSNSVFVLGFEMQNTVKSVYGADILAGAGYYKGERKKGSAFFFPGIFAERAGAYFKRYGEELTRKAMAKWYEQSILHARLNPKAQEYQNTKTDLFALGMTPPNPSQFLPYINLFDCSKVTDGAASIVIASEEGLKKLGISPDDAVEIISLGEAEGDISKKPEDETVLTQSKLAAQKAFETSELTPHDLGVLEVHDCFSITGLLMLEAIGAAPEGESPEYVLHGHSSMQGMLPTNLSGGLIGFGHPTGASGVRMMVDIQKQLTEKAALQAALKKPFGMMVSMGGNDKTVTAIIAKSP